MTCIQVSDENTELQGKVTQMEEKLSLAEQEKQRIEKVSCHPCSSAVWSISYTDTHTDTHTQTNTHRQTHTDKHTHTHRQTHTHTNTQRDKHTHRQIHTHRQTNTHTHSPWSCNVNSKCL